MSRSIAKGSGTDRRTVGSIAVSFLGRSRLNGPPNADGHAGRTCKPYANILSLKCIKNSGLYHVNTPIWQLFEAVSAGRALPGGAEGRTMPLT
jgi:hypothetical protein